jgi:hypothetical protein
VLFLVIVTLLLCLLFQPTLSSSVSEIAKPFHEACRLASPSSRHSELYEAIVCGAQLSKSPLKDALKTSGLIHLMIVSGSHLVFLTQLIEILIDRITSASHQSLKTPCVRWKLITIVMGLLVFALACRFQPPVARAWFYLLLAQSNLSWRLQWTKLQRITLSSLLALPFCASQNDLYSLFLSWTASLALLTHGSTTGPSGSPLNSILREAKTYLVLLPALIPIGAPHPLSITAQVAMGPLLSRLLFPAALMAMFVSPLALLIDVLWDAAIWCCMELGRRMPDGWARRPWGLLFMWSYVLALTMAFEWSRKTKANVKGNP